MSIYYAVAWLYLCLPSRNNLARKGPFLLHLAGSCKNPEESCRTMHVRLLQDPAACKRKGPFLASFARVSCKMVSTGSYATTKGIINRATKIFYF